MRKITAAAIVAAVATVGLAGLANADSFTFGVMADTQQTGYADGGSNTVSTKVISEVNKQFNAAGVDFVIQVGDMTDTGSPTNLQTRLDANAGTATYTVGSTSYPVTGLNVPFYALRGNHEDDSNVGAQTFFQNNFIPRSSPGVNVEMAPDNTSYAITYKNAKFVLLDIDTAYSTTAMDSATSWMNSVLGENDHNQAFVFQHKNLIGQNHKDNAFQTSSSATAQDNNPVQQYNFIKTLATNGVRYDMSGHDHMNHRAIVTTAGLPAGQTSDYSVQQLILQSDSTKFYTATSGWDGREQSISDQQGKIGYYTFTVNGPRVTGRYYTAEKNTAGAGTNGTIMDNPLWTLQDTFGYSLNGKQKTVGQGQSLGIGASPAFTDDTSTAISHGESGYLAAHTTMSISNYTNSSTTTAEGGRPVAIDLNSGWSPRPSATMVSDQLSLWGMGKMLGSAQTDPFLLTMSYDASLVADGKSPTLMMLNGNTWQEAVLADYGGTANFVGGRAFNSATDGLGSYGFDPSTQTAWAVVNHNSDFAVAVPEPASLGLLGASALIVLRRKRH